MRRDVGNRRRGRRNARDEGRLVAADEIDRSTGPRTRATESM
jgi:hypothetical protein